MKHPKRKPKPKPKPKPTQDSQPPERVTVAQKTVQPAPSPGTQFELETPPRPVDIREQTESLPDPDVQSPDAELPAPEAPPAGADRRIHPRYAFSAPVEIVAHEPGARLESRLHDLSQQGCYVDTDTPFVLGTATELRITKGARTFEARARVVYNQPRKGMGLVFTAVEPQHLTTLHTWIVESRETSWLAANRRRSQRVLMKIPVRVSSQAGTTLVFEEDTHTLAISAHGALIALAAPAYRGQRLTLANIQTKAALECVVAHVEKIPGEQFNVGIEFLLPNPTFWHVAFPPKDWTPRHPDAKSG